MWVLSSDGGMFNLIHLWFLYYLLLLYVLTLAVRSILSRPCMRAWGDRRVTQIFSAPASILWLVLLTGFCLWPMKSWFGADTPNASFRVSLPVLLLYGVFFVLGWLLHRQAHLLGHLVRHWRWQLGLPKLAGRPWPRLRAGRAHGLGKPRPLPVRGPPAALSGSGRRPGGAGHSGGGRIPDRRSVGSVCGRCGL